jgi:hypothetical protein
MSEQGCEAGFSLVSLVLAMLICLALVVIYLREAAPVDSKGGVPGGALRAARSQARNFEEQQQKRLEEMRKIAPQ